MSKRSFISKFEEWNQDCILSVVGPTGAGKSRSLLDYINSKFSAKLREPLLVSVDSIAVYKGLDVGSAKVCGKDRRDFDWVGVDLIEVSQRLSAKDFMRVLSVPINEALAAKRPVVLVGGSFFYERMLVEGTAPGAASDPAFLLELEKQGLEQVYQQLCSLDSDFSRRVAFNDRYRVFRFADLMLRQKFSYQDLLMAREAPFKTSVQTLIMGLEPKVTELQLKSRIESMFENGWEEEVKKLLEFYSPEAHGLKSIGYRELVLAQLGEIKRTELVDRVLISHRQLAKKQRTWLRGLLSKV